MSSLEPSYLISQLPSSTSGVENHSFKDQYWMYSTFTLLALLTAVLVYSKLKLTQAQKNLQFEQFKSQDLKKKLKLALHTIKKMETNPDLVHSRSFNLDYLRMRMDEEVFHYVIVNQIKIKIIQLIGEALRPSTAKNAVGIVPGTRQIEETFDVTYEIETQEGTWNKGILFRIQIKLTKLPTQTSTATVNEIIECIEIFLSAAEEQDNWQPAIHGHVVLMSWDQKAKPTPLMILEQSEEGVNVSFRSTPVKSLSSAPSNFSE
ncbi:hypothetical protein [Chroococcus sp. FPU101]|uniref:hypothetical protein n=1 Tax=Chroococcus sp. FPU101 TaxID=1974212 RepID=UPI001AA83A90|nr:hypothetical protein [Chroococcus sp. FPU101]GFE71563.1 hypothetical protein CFPU101_41730 [Chroococcus sp. FPU101]